MKLIETLPDLIKNILYLESQLNSNKASQNHKAGELLRAGICFVKYREGGKSFFAPSRFIGYLNNTIYKHDNPDKHGTTTNVRIKKILNQVAKPNAILENEYFKFCNKYAITPNKKASYGHKRKFWDLDELHTNIYGDVELPDGRKRLITHIIRERNPRARQMAIDIFLTKNKTLHCEACRFDFQKKYGEQGINFIEVHHTIPVSKMLKGHKTNPIDLVLLCSNCHRMVHRGEKWLTISELKQIIKKRF